MQEGKAREAKLNVDLVASADKMEANKKTIAEAHEHAEVLPL